MSALPKSKPMTKPIPIRQPWPLYPMFMVRPIYGATLEWCIIPTLTYERINGMAKFRLRFFMLSIGIEFHYHFAN